MQMRSNMNMGPIMPHHINMIACATSDAGRQLPAIKQASVEKPAAPQINTQQTAKHY